MKQYKELITELFDKPAKLGYKKKTDTLWEAIFTINDVKYIVAAELVKPIEYPEGWWEIIFGTLDGNEIEYYGKTGLGSDVAVIVFSTLLQFIKELIEEREPAMIKFSASESKFKKDRTVDTRPNSRISLYKSMIRRFVPKNYIFEIIEHRGWKTEFIIRHK